MKHKGNGRVELSSGRQIALHAICFHTGLFLGLFFDPEAGGDMFL
jgi:hypothetical protein